jgi:hypothetical protein
VLLVRQEVAGPLLLLLLLLLLQPGMLHNSMLRCLSCRTPHGVAWAVLHATALSPCHESFKLLCGRAAMPVC